MVFVTIYVAAYFLCRVLSLAMVSFVNKLYASACSPSIVSLVTEVSEWPVVVRRVQYLRHTTKVSAEASGFGERDGARGARNRGAACRGGDRNSQPAPLF